MVGGIIENYKMISVLGEGGMGIVYKAFYLKLERYVAIKILNSQALLNPQFVARFKREAKNQAKLNHPNIVPVYGFAEANRTLGIVMEYVEGETLENIIERNGKLPLLDALNILKQILTGADYAHSKGFVHRDLKPSNIIISNEGVAKIMDFGISKSMFESQGITKTGTKIGTILYMSPEQIKAMEPTAQSDIYSIGISFFEMLKGKTPFDVGNEFQIMEAHLKKNPTKLSSMSEEIPNEVDRIIAKALNKSTAKRYQTCGEFLIEVDNLIEQLTSSQTKKKTRTKTKAKIQNNKKFKLKVRFFIFAFFITVLITSLFYFMYHDILHLWSRVNNEKVITKPVSNSFNLVSTKWKSVNSPTLKGLNSISFVSDSTGYACGEEGTVIKTVNGGKSWIFLSDSSSINFYDIKFISPQKGFIVGSNGTILSTTDEGNNWHKVNYKSPASLFKICFLKNTTVGFIVGANGTILKTYDNGVHWLQIPAPSKEVFYSISFADANNGYVVGKNGIILKSPDQGNTWIEDNKLNNQYIKDIYFINNKIGILAGGNGEIARTSDGGKDWEIIPTKIASGLYSVNFLNQDTGIILGGNGEILISKDSGKTWDISQSGVYASLNGSSETPSNKIYIVTNIGKILSN